MRTLIATIAAAALSLLGCTNTVTYEDPPPPPADGDDAGDDDDTGDDDSGDDDTGDDDLGDDDGGDDDVQSPISAEECFGQQWDSIPGFVPDYDAYDPVLGLHCHGTNHQQIQGVERVVFVGDSITSGTPPTSSGDWFRNQLAVELAALYGLQPPDPLWMMVDLNGEPFSATSGDFACCSKWGARTDDMILPPHQQLETCIPESERHKTHLVVMTVGGNDVLKAVQAGWEGEPLADTWQRIDDFTALQRDAVAWFSDPPDKFPGGVYLIFANNLEYTDGTGDLSDCPGAGMLGLSTPWNPTSTFTEMVAAANEAYLSIAVDHQVDMVFLHESFCGHGFNSGDPSAPCYRAGGAPLWFDDTCIHPNAAGHTALAEMVMEIVLE